MKLEIHPDGEWNTERYEYKGRTIEIKSRDDHGIKAHCYHQGKVVFTQRFVFIRPARLLKRMERRIDMWISGEWTPKKLLKQR